MSKQPGINDAAWKQISEKYDILGEIERRGIFRISAAQIKEFREPRLMVKFDHHADLPEFFSKNKLAILPVTRGDYVISHFDAYHRFEPDKAEIMRVSLPEYINSLDYYHITSETIALNCAVASGIIADFIEDEKLLATVSGRMSSGTFDFKIHDKTAGISRLINVNHSQIEIDAAYEGLSYLAVIEAKREIHEDFLIRQLYYPFRAWKHRVKKTIKPIFLVYSNGIYRLYEYQFQDVYDYNSLRLVKQKKYSLEDTSITSSDIQNILDAAATVPEPPLPFPQADRFERVINICELVYEQELSRTDVTERYDFDARQTNYYTDAARYLGLVEKKREQRKPVYSISTKGRAILGLRYKQRQLAFCQCILEHKPFQQALQRYFDRGVAPTQDEIVSIMKRSSLYRVGHDSTYKRRSSTIRGWLDWIVNLVNE